MAHLAHSIHNLCRPRLVSRRYGLRRQRRPGHAFPKNKESMNGELRSLYIDSNFAKKDANNRYQYDLVGGVAVPENSRVYVDNISFRKGGRQF